MLTTPEKDSSCPRCGGLIGDTRLEWEPHGGGISFSCLSCDYERRIPATGPSFWDDYPALWQLRIRWSGETVSLKEAALLRQFVPGFRRQSIAEVREFLGSASGWTVDELSEPSMRQIRQDAEDRGFQVEVGARGSDRPQVRLPRPGSGTAGYCVRLSPSFHERGFILATFGPEGGAVSIARGNSSRETVDVPSARGLRFLEEVTALEPLSIPDVSTLGLDGISLECLVQEARGNHRFFAWSPRPDKAPRQHGFVGALFRLAMDVARESGTVEYLEQLHMYVEDVLPAKVFEETPRRIRLFGMLSSTHAEALRSLFAGVRPGEPIVMDLSNLEGMGTLLHPLFARFHARTGRTVWRVSAPAARHLEEAGVSKDCLYEDLEQARAALLRG
ncbi:hypothetical protein [Hyalangium gracile]|uniref:hypothetical protein n=1 Tax=Hyalangium gracile TaxID=394092 RepID=UPI001CCECA45|nr:hypothetical protein [Hyalangium gracile]